MSIQFKGAGIAVYGPLGVSRSLGSYNAVSIRSFIELSLKWATNLDRIADS